MDIAAENDLTIVDAIYRQVNLMPDAIARHPIAGQPNPDPYG